MTVSRIYLDYAASAPLKPSVQRRMQDAMAWVGNSSSLHHEGRALRKTLDDARVTLKRVLSLEDPDAYQVVWTSGGTEANQTCLHGMRPHVSSIWVSSVEHPSVFVHGDDILPVTTGGRLRLDVLEDKLQQARAPVCVSVQWVNSETGVTQPLESIGACVKKYNGFFHVDATQGLGVEEPLASFWKHADAITVSAHKIGGPAGMGALVLKESMPCEPLVRGGFQEARRRAGTPNILGVVGFEAALQDLDLGFAQDMRVWRKSLIQNLQDQAPDIRIWGDSDHAAPHIVSLWMPGVHSQKQQVMFDLKGYAVSVGTACHAGKVGGSDVLRAMGCSQEQAEQSLRISWGWGTDWQDIQNFQQAWIALYHQTKTEAAS